MGNASRAEKEFRSTTKLIVEKLRESIVTGKLSPGERLVEDKLASWLKVRPMPLREALRQLEAEGYVTFVARGEMAVSKPTADDVQDYYSIASVLEGLAARLAVQRGSAEEISRLRELHQILKEAYRDKNLPRYFNANSKFHSFIAEMAQNSRLHRLIQEMRQEIQKARILALNLPHRLDYSMREHDQILDAFLKKNSDLAQSVVETHLHNQMTAIKQMLQSEEA